MIPLENYTYHLPAEKIALHPLQERDQSKLLVSTHGTIAHSHFNQLIDFLPKTAFLFFNNTKVIPARLHFKKETGADIELFLLQPVSPSPLVQLTMESLAAVQWQCTIGNLKRWKDETILVSKIDEQILRAKLIDRESGLVEFTSDPPRPFAEVLKLFGATPLPPYIKRTVEPADEERYQTVYSNPSGAVAAPTAGLHFTPTLLKQMQLKGIRTDFLTLHVSAGTFQPIKTQDAADHVMHAEQVVVTQGNLKNLLIQDQYTIAVGTTSMRTLESLYWFGARVWRDPEDDSGFVVRQSDPYDWKGKLPTRSEALIAVMNWMERKQISTLTGETSIFIVPGYPFQMCRGLITNFHQPGSTLLLLISAFIGDRWKAIYSEALEKNYRFLSFGDSSLLLQ